MTPGTRLVNEIMLSLSEAGCLVWRNTTGQAYQGRVVHRDSRQVTLADSRVITFGLCVGSADIIGITPDGRFIAVEVKAGKDTIKPEQRKFVDAVRAFGGCAGFARSTQDAIDILNS